MLGIKLVIVSVVGLEPTIPTEEPAAVKLLVEIDRSVPAGLVLGLMLTVIEVLNTWKLDKSGATARVLVEAVMVMV